MRAGKVWWWVFVCVSANHKSKKQLRKRRKREFSGWVYVSFVFIVLDKVCKCVFVHTVQNVNVSVYSRSNGQIGSWQWADLCHFLCFLQRCLLIGCFLLFLLILLEQERIIFVTWSKPTFQYTYCLKWAKSRLPWRQLGTSVPPPRLEVL